MTRAKTKPEIGSVKVLRARIHAECGRCGLTVSINAPTRLRYVDLHCPVCREEMLMFSTVMA